MRPTRFLLALALGTCSISAWAADVEFGSGTDNQSADLQRNFAQATYDHPLYKGLWPMTLAVSRATDSVADMPTENLDFAVPTVIVEDHGMSLASNEPRALRNSLWKMTRDRFAELEQVHYFGGVAFVR